MTTKNHVVEGSVSQNMLKDCSPLGKLKDKSSVCTRKLSSENTSAEIVNDDTPKIKKKCSPSSSTRNNVSVENLKIQKEEKIRIISSCSPVRQTSPRKFVKSKHSGNKSDGCLPLLTSEENDEKMQGSSKYRQNRVKEKSLDSAKEEVNKTLQKSKINKNNTWRQMTSDEEILLKSDADTSGLQTQLKGTTEELTEGAGQKKLRGNKYKVKTQNDVETNPSIKDKDNIIERKRCTRDSQKMLTKEGSLPKKEEESNGIMHKNKVNTRSSLNKDSVSTAGICAKVPDMDSTNNVHKQTVKYSESFERSFDGGKRSVESKINSSNKKQKIATDESRNKRCLQTEEIVSKSGSQTITAVDEDNLNLSQNSQRNQRVTDTHSRKRSKKSSLPKKVDSSCTREDQDKTVIFAGKTKVDSSQLSSVKKGEASSPVATRTQLKCLTNIGKRQSSPKISTAPAEQTRVMFTGLSGEQLKAQEAIVERLGGSVVDQPGAEMVLVAQKLCRTIKMLCAVAQGIPVVNCSWLVSCSKKNHFVGTDDFTLHDKEGEKKFKMSLSKTLLASTQHPLLAGYTVMVTPHVVPVPKDMKVLVESCGGAFLARSPRNWPSKAFVISCEKDKSQWQKLRKAGVPVVGPEVILTGVLQHKIDLTTHQLGCA